MSDDRRCHRGSQCHHWERVDNRKVGALIEAEKGLCESCRRHLEECLGQLHGDYAQLAKMLGEPAGGGGQKVNGTRELPVPLRLSVEALQAEMLHVTWTWAEVVARVMGIDGQDRYDLQHTRPIVLMEKSAALLSRSVSVLLAARDEEVAVWTDEESTENARPIQGTSRMHPPATIDHRYSRKGQWDYETQDGLDGAVQLIDLHHHARRTLGVGKAFHRYELPCPRCEGQLTREYGDDTVSCGGCSVRRTIKEYEDLCLLLARRKGV